MPVPAVSAEDHIALPQMRADTDSDRFFTDVRMAGPVDKPALVRPGKLFFALADDLHVVKQVEERLFVDSW
jgi:hypothetical protein